MCYESEARCHFTCGHNLCHECTKTWYMKGKSTCPMCRASMCFKGITKLKKRWYREKQEETYKSLVIQMFDELMEEYGDIILKCLEVVQNRYEYTILKHPDISCELLDLIIRMTWVDIDYIMKSPIENIYEPKTFTKYLLVSKYKHFNKKLGFRTFEPLMAKFV